MTIMYRNSVQIGRFVAKQLGLPYKEEHMAGVQGPEPQSVNFADMESLCAHVAAEAGALVAEGCPMSEIAVLYAARKLGDVDTVPELLLSHLQRQGLMVTWAAEDARAKRNYDIKTDSVTTSTIHSDKAMAYAHVLLVGLPAVTAGRAGYTATLA